MKKASLSVVQPLEASIPSRLHLLDVIRHFVLGYRAGPRVVNSHGEEVLRRRDFAVPELVQLLVVFVQAQL